MLNRFFKRLFDIVLSLLLMLFLAPLLLIMAILCVFLQGRPIMFLQARLAVGHSMDETKEFLIWKFRTMNKQGNEITRLGKFMRPLGIDELPQLWNILKGDMSFIGPRPLTQSDVIRLEWDLETYNIRWAAKPGLVGLAQFSPVCDKDISFSLDKQYIEQQSLWLDMRIFAWAALVPLLGKQRIIAHFNKR